MSEITVRRIGDCTAEINIQQNRNEAHTVRVYRRRDGGVSVSWPMLQDVNARTTRLYAEALMMASRLAEEFCLPCPNCGGCLEIHRGALAGANGDLVQQGHVYRCTECGSVIS
jgi:hypothetical protein